MVFSIAVSIISDCLLDGFDSPGNDIGNVTANNILSCREACQKVPSCIAFVFNQTDHQCALKHNIGEKKAAWGKKIGSKYCPGNKILLCLYIYNENPVIIFLLSDVGRSHWLPLLNPLILRYLPFEWGGLPQQ